MGKTLKLMMPLCLWLSAAAALAIAVEAGMDCGAVGTLIATCTEYVNYGYPDPIPGSRCCDSMNVLSMYSSDSTASKRWLCHCFIHLITLYNPNATAIATLSGFCGVVLGFTVDPNTDCNFIQ
ncbi:PREDICTED: putative non-specific lipid-transfer protein 14 [Tarenaya hassleriana]|uniref:putative non-specific lipid-transfer protein 14 n=1 Tax=Tarenaya hassleriana TaxID=28532 RepID=UPI00053CA331|nr:PREDICTED: putative non-specific lipid-transfer protein 14 [Tarenaya hassleriana]